MADTIKFSQLGEISRAQMAGSDYAVGYKANGDNKKWTFENQADFLLNDSEAGQEFQETFVKVQNTEPTDENNKIWIEETPENEVEVPTYDEFKDLSNLVSGVNEAVFNKLSATADQVSTYIPFTFSTFAGKRYIIKNESSAGGMLARIRQTRDGENGTYITNGTQAGQTSVYEAAEDADYIAVMFGPTSTNPAFSIIQEDDVPSKVEDLKRATSELDERMDNIVIFSDSVNKINPADKTHGAILDDGTVSTSGSWNSYDTSDFIPVEAGTTYTLYFADATGATALDGQRLMYLLLDGSKEPLTHSNTVTSLKTITPSVNGYIRVSSHMNYFSTYLMLIEGTTTIPYTAYSESAEYAEGVDFNAAQTAFIQNKAKEVLEDYLAEGAISVNISGNTITLKSNLNNYKVEHTLYKETIDRNHLPQFYIDKIYNSENVQIATKPADDDIAPIRIFYFETVGANHGYPFGYRMTKNGQTSADIGSVWTDGTTDYLLYAVDDTYVWLAAPYGVYSGNLRPNTDRPTTDLTAKSGAAHTDTISISGYTRGNQIYPSVNNIKTTLYADGEVISGDYTGTCKEFVLDNEYGIISYVGMWEYMTAHVGNIETDDIPDIIKMHIRTTFKPGGQCFVSTTLYAVSEVKLADCGFLQAQPITVPTGGSKWRYINGLNAISGYDFSDFINVTSYNVDLVATASDLADNTVPPNRLVDWIYDSSNNKVVGFTLGYVADIADGANDKRIAHTTSLWDIRKNNKIYPIALSAFPMQAGESVTVCGYRNYLYPTDLINNNVYEYGNSVYASIDAKDGLTIVPTDGKYSGYKVDVIDESSADVINEAVSTGIIVDVDNCGGANVKLS